MAVETLTENYLRHNQKRFLENPSGLQMYELNVLFRMTGSQKIAREIRERCKHLGTFMRNEMGAVIFD